MTTGTGALVGLRMGRKLQLLKGHHNYQLSTSQAEQELVWAYTLCLYIVKDKSDNRNWHGALVGLHIGHNWVLVVQNKVDNNSSRTGTGVGLHIGHNWPLPVIEAHAQAWHAHACLSPKFKLAQIKIQTQGLCIALPFK